NYTIVLIGWNYVWNRPNCRDQPVHRFDSAGRCRANLAKKERRAVKKRGIRSVRARMFETRHRVSAHKMETPLGSFFADHRLGAPHIGDQRGLPWQFIE